MAFAHRLVAALDRGAGLARQVAVVQRGLELRFEIIFAALDFVDDGFFVAAGDGRLLILESLMRLTEERARIFRLAAEAPHLRTQIFDDFLALVRALAESLAQALIVDVRG
jgi:hypothetical protein